MHFLVTFLSFNCLHLKERSLRYFSHLQQPVWHLNFKNTRCGNWNCQFWIPEKYSKVSIFYSCCLKLKKKDRTKVLCFLHTLSVSPLPQNLCHCTNYLNWVFFFLKDTPEVWGANIILTSLLTFINSQS